MKKTSKCLSALLLVGQVFGYTPAVLANEQGNNQLTNSQSATITEETTTNSTGEENQPETPTEDTIDTPDNPEMNAPPTGSEEQPETPNQPDKPEDNQQPEEEPSEEPNEQPSDESSQTPQKPSTETEAEPPTKTERPQKAPEQSVTVPMNDVPQAQSIGSEETKNYHQAPSAPIQELVPSSTQDNEGTIHFEKDASVETFIRKIGESARKIGQENDLYASVMIAQAILESASGQSQLAQAPNYNLFGIKGTHNGKGVSFATQEDLGNGTLYTTQATFRQYESYEESLKDYAKLLKEGLVGNTSFYDGVWKSKAKTYQEATKFLTGRYATDTSYDKKLNGLIETYDLIKYDKEVAGPQLSKEGYMVPLKNYSISSSFGWRGEEFHRGLDMAANQGEPIYASKAGTVIEASYHTLSGNYVTIEHEDGSVALYAHQQEYCVNVGQTVEQGQIIGYVGSTGNSTGPHLHLELALDGSLTKDKLINPETVLF
ncbi:TPA: peptidoglycan DD-metalloendopeptidase family protein [Enterococcus faecium]|nr:MULTISPECIES: glucosaminidase domain-containing protein [Enterococcus]AQT58107.1 N-acetylmuramoyl-L-alanine amidase domain-containing protein precursor [Enterococcus faecium]AQY29476.1 N-acetylmuramoyl-L-alanine amidase [Enterococcus faecium]AQY31739.1 N-acetylmuramoyl-L-alanine amidase [Enterococcus faecium]MBQ1101731.1 peptidoglycan DD-metalloendopeptidase family protein [Enterococcus faecium]MBQ1127631.1 peptidoglycan DD-metalloendopeptidase family protein [Enterococcus faecium]